MDTTNATTLPQGEVLVERRDAAQELAALNEKIDALAAQVAFLTEQARVAERERQDREELARDLLPVAKEAYLLTLRQLDEIEGYVDVSDALRVLKRLARNARNLDEILDQIESVSDLTDTAGPIADEAFAKTVRVLAQAEHRGYFAFARGGLKILDNIVTSFSEEDVRQLGENIVLILQTIKGLTQPQVMAFVQNTVTEIERAPEGGVNNSTLSLLRQLRDPAVRRGIAQMLRVLRTVGTQTAPTPN